VHAAAVVGERANSGQRGRVCTSADPIGFRSSTRDVETQSATEEHTNGERGDDGGLGVRRTGADLGQRWSRQQRSRGVYAYGSSRVPQVCARFEDVERSTKVHQ